MPDPFSQSVREVVSRWDTVLACTHPADFGRAERSVANIYQALGWAPPRIVVRAESPLAAMRAIAEGSANVGRETARAYGMTQGIRTQIAAVMHRAEDALWRRETFEGAGMGADSRMLVMERVIEEALNRIRSYAVGVWKEMVEVTLRAGWYPQVEFVLANPGKKGEVRHTASGICREFLTIRECAWGAYFSESIAAISDRPAEIHWNDAGQIHHESGPAIRWRDGWSIWCIGGVLVDEEIVLSPERQLLADIKGERDAEVKRIRINRWAGAGATPADGWCKYLKAIGAKTVDSRENLIENTLEKLLRSSAGEKLLVCACPSTARVYALEVPAEIRSCEQAQFWLWNQSSAAGRHGGRMRIIGRS